MKICIFDLQKNKNPFYRNGIKTLAEIIKSRGFEVVCSTEPDIRDILSSGLIIISCSKQSYFSSKLEPSCREFLSRAKGLSGKKTFALLIGSGPFSGKALLNLMALAESEGMKILNSQFTSSLTELEMVGKTLKIPVS